MSSDPNDTSPESCTKLLKSIIDLNNPLIAEPTNMWDNIERVFEEEVHLYKLKENSPFRVLATSETMVLRNGLVIIGGKTSSGKTSFATHLALEIIKERKRKVGLIFFSLDDSANMSWRRIASQINSYVTF